MFLQPIRKLINFNEMLQSGMSGFKRFQAILKEEEEYEIENPKELKNIKGNIEIDNVSFKYEEENKDDEVREEVIFENFSLNIEAGKMVALVGPSGGGKTTLCNLIPRFYEYNSGDIRIDGTSIRDVSLSFLRNSIGVVQQDVFLFTGTIKENIVYGKYSATEEEIIEAAKKACLHDFIMTLPDKYETFIGKRGVKLSGGQKQRVSIARVFLKNPPIVILDEATSALDNFTEAEIQKSLENLSVNRTTLVVAHRLTTIKNADEIVVLSRKGIEERGSHKELLKKEGLYSKLNAI